MRGVSFVVTGDTANSYDYRATLRIIFQQGHLESLLGFTSFGGIMDWAPLFMFVFLFGLSMDYHVFILSRIKELRGRGASTPDAVIGGIASGAGVVTSAAVIMVAVFSIFASLSIVRGICVPAALAALAAGTQGRALGGVTALTRARSGSHGRPTSPARCARTERFAGGPW